MTGEDILLLQFVNKDRLSFLNFFSTEKTFTILAIINLMRNQIYSLRRQFKDWRDYQK